MTKRNSSGQILVASVLIIALILLSTELYIYELGKTIGEANSNVLSDFIFAIRSGSHHIVVGSLANVSRGGANQTLTINLQKWVSFVERQYQFGTFLLDFTPREISPYSSGIRIFWGSDGVGVSGAYVNFTLELSDRGVNVTLPYTINITTTLLVQGTYTGIQGNVKQVNVTCNLLNEGKPALAKDIILYYKNLSNWLVPGPSNNYTLTNYGNGTYFMSFLANISFDNVEVSVHVCNQREIYVKTNATCSEI